MDNKMTVIDALSLFDTTKEQRLDFAKQVVETLRDGKVDALHQFAIIKAMGDIISTLTDTSDKNSNKNLAIEFKGMLMDSASKYGTKFIYGNSDFEIKEMGIKYDYSNCNDSTLKELEAQKEQIDKLVKERQEFLKELPTNPFDFLNKETGEVEELNKPIKTSTTTLVTKFK